jgi:hypothetical protein
MSTRYLQIIHISGYVQNITYFICIEHGAQAPWCPGYFTIYIGKIRGAPWCPGTQIPNRWIDRRELIEIQVYFCDGTR